jgi:hypothetical protein
MSMDRTTLASRYIFVRLFYLSFPCCNTDRTLIMGAIG